MGPPPKKIDGADVLVWAALDESVTATGYCTDSAARGDAGPAAALAICVYFDQYGLFHCDRHWRVLGNTSHDTLELAQRQAEAEYAGVSKLWRPRA
jgi:hypothetical protein